MPSPSLFSDELLLEPAFTERLRAVLDQARAALQLDVIALFELLARDGRVAPALVACSPTNCQLTAPSLELFEELSQRVDDEPVRPLRGAQQQALGAALCERSAASLLALSVQPRLSRHPDTLLVAAHREPLPAQPQKWLALKTCLERGLSEDRRKRLAATVFAAVQQATDPIELTDSEARLLYANAAWERTFGYVTNEVVGQTVGRLFRDPVAPIHDSAFYQFTLATLAEGGAWSGALACRARDGTRVFCEPMVSPFDAKEQGFAGNFAVRRNLAQRAARDAALAIAHHEFRSVLAALPEGVTVLRDARIYFVNAALLHILGRTEQSIVGLPFTEFVHPDDRAHLPAAHNGSAARLRMLRPDGSVRFIEISSAGAVSFEGKPATILLSRDVTDQRVAQEQLARAERLSALGALAAGVAHEINNPLTYVALNLQYIQQTQQLQGLQRTALREALDGTTRIAQIVAELRSYTGPDAPGPPQPVEVIKAANSAINIAQNEIRHRARLQRRLEPGLYVLAREGQLVQVLVNLLVNAAQAIPGSDDSAHHLVSISAEAVSRDVVALEVSDSGVGIAPNQLPHVLEPFATSKPRGEGTGLGLAISKRIVEELGGRISLSSQLGVGTTVRIELPRAAATSVTVTATPEAARAPAEAPREQTGQAATVKAVRLLIVDDEVTIANTLQSVFADYDVSVAIEAAQAIELIKTGPSYDVVLCDLMMPGMTGPELYRMACQMDPMLRSRFVFMTGGAFTREGREFLERTPCPVLTKPFTIQSAFSMVDSVAGQKPVATLTSHTEKP